MTTRRPHVLGSTFGGQPDRDGYTVSVDSGPARAIGDNDSLTFAGLAAGAHTVFLSGLALNCGVREANPQTVTVPAGGNATAADSVGCPFVAWGYLTVTTTTTGADLDPDGYAVTVSSAIEGSISGHIDTNGSLRVRLTESGNWTVTLSHLAANCTVAGDNPRTMWMYSYPDSNATQFSVTCAPNQPPTASFTTSCDRLACTFTDTSTDPDGSVVAWQWTWSDGATSTDQNPSHTFARVGSYTVTLTVTDNQGVTSAATAQTVKVGRRKYDFAAWDARPVHR